MTRPEAVTSSLSLAAARAARHRRRWRPSPHCLRRCRPWRAAARGGTRRERENIKNCFVYLGFANPDKKNLKKN